MSLQPFNITILDPEEYITKRQLLPVTTSTIFEPSTTRFHPDGLYSEVIFGQIGSTERIVRGGYMDLRCNVITPHLYKQLITLKGYYKDIMAGRKYAYFDNKAKDFMSCPEHTEGAGTGYTFFLKHLKDIQFVSTGSTRRQDKIDLLKKYKDRLVVTRFIVLPAGVRDIKFTDGRIKSEEINKLYSGLLSLIKALPEKISEDPLYDSIRFQIQSKVQDIYEYICDLLDDKGGFGQSKYAARNISYGTRNVITACILSRTASATAPNAVAPDEVELPLFQCMKAATPLVVNKLKTVIFEQIFTGNDRIALINTDTCDMEYVTVTTETMNRYTTAQGLEELINEFQNRHWLMQPATVDAIDEKGKSKPYYLRLVCDLGDSIFTLRGKTDFENMMKSPPLYLDKWSPLDIGCPYVLALASALDAYSNTKLDRTYIVVKDHNYTEFTETATEVDDNYFGVPCLKLKDKEIYVYGESSLTTLGLTTQEIFDTAVEYNGFLVQNIATFKKPFADKSKLLKSHWRVVEPYLIQLEGKIRPMTWVEIGYLACFSAIRDKHATATRYPILNFEGLAMNRIHLMTTQPSRVVTGRFHSGDPGQSIVLPEYPRMDSTIKTSMSVHPSTLEAYDGDHDGDVLSAMVLLGDESNTEVNDYLHKPISMVDDRGDLIYGLRHGRTVRYTMNSATYRKLPE